MKKFALLLSIIILQQYSFAQTTVGIGTTTPNASAALDITHISKGLLIPRIALLATSDNTTIVTPATGLMVWNTNVAMPGGPGFFFNNGTPASPTWTRVGELILPYYRGVSPNAHAFQIENYNSSPTSSAIRGFSQGGTGILGASGSGNALEANGRVKIYGPGEDPAQGKVLTSDANGNATWEGAVAFSASGIITGNFIIAPSTLSRIAFKNVQYDLGSDYNTSTANPHSTFIAPVSGIYHFDAQLVYTGSAIYRPAIYMNMKRGAAESTLASYVHTAVDTRATQLSISKDVKLQAGDQVYILTKQDSGDHQYLESDDAITWFSGRLVIKL